MTAKFLIAPTYVLGTNYLRSLNRNPREWRILTGRFEDIQKIRGLTEAEIEYISSSAYINFRHLEELLSAIEHRALTVKEVHY